MQSATSNRRCSCRWKPFFIAIVSPLWLVSCNDASSVDGVTLAFDSILLDEATVMHVDTASGRKKYTGFCTHLTHGDEVREYVALLLGDDGAIHVFGLDGPGVPPDLPEYIADMNLNGRIAGVYVRQRD